MENNSAQELPNEKAQEKKGFFDSIEIKGLSSKSARAFSTGRLGNVLKIISRLLAYTPARVYGIISLTFGILTLFLHLGEYYFMEDPEVAVSSLVIGAAFCIVSIFLLISDKPISIALQSVKLIDFIVFDFFSIGRMQAREGEKKLSPAVGIIVGVLLSLSGFLFPTEYTALAIVVTVFFIVAMVSPEFPYIFSLLIFPYLPLMPYSSYVLAIITLITIISFLRKVLIGKRMYALEIYDFLLIFLIFAVLLTGVILGGESSTEISLFIIVFILSYIPASNVAVNRRLCDCIASAIVVSSIPVSLHSVVKYIINWSVGRRGPVSAFFASPAVFAAFLSVSVIISLYLSVKRSRPSRKRYYFATFILSSLAIVTTEYFAIVSTLLVVIFALALIRARGIPRFTVTLLLLAPFCLFLLPSSALSGLSKTFGIAPSLEELLEGSGESLSLFFENMFLGIGANEYGAGGHLLSNTYLALACRFGILAVLVFFITLVVRIIHLSVHEKYFSDSTVGFYADMCTLASVAMLSLGSFFDIFEDVTMVYFFVSVFATGSSALRVSKREREERLSYYKDSGSSDYAAIDVRIRRKR